MNVLTQLLDADFAERLEGLSDPLELIDRLVGEPARAINGSTYRPIRVSDGE